MGESNISGPLNIDDSIVLGEDATVGDDLVVTDDAAITGDLSVTGNSTFTGTVSITGALTLAATPVIPTGSISSTMLAEDAGFENPITFYAAATIAIGEPVYISGYSTGGGVEVSLAYSTRTCVADFIAVTAATAADVTLTVAPVLTVTGATSTSVAGTILYLSSVTGAGGYSTSVPSSGPIIQKIGVITTLNTGSSDGNGVINLFPGYSHVVNSSLSV